MTDRQEGEHLEVFDLQEGDLVITDRANGLRQRIVFVLRKGADLVVRFTPHKLPLQAAPGKPLDVVRWLKGCPAPAGRVVSRGVWISYQGQLFAVHCIGLRLSEQQRAAAERRKQRTAKRKQQQVQADTLYLAGWVLLVTTLPSEHWSAQQVLRLYQARWHIELGAEAHQTALEAAEPAMHDGSDGSADNHGTLAGVGVVGRREHCHPCGDARCHALPAASRRAEPDGARGYASLLVAGWT